MKHRNLILAAMLLSLILSTGLGGFATPTQAAPAVPAFPGAVGFGAGTPGGRGGRVIYVTTLNDSGAGSLREALTASGPRTVLFKVAGTIQLQNDISISQPYVTVAGQTAPGQGVQIKGGMIKIETHNVILRYLKVRKGNPTGGNPADTDPVSIAGNRTEVYNIILDHSTLIWGTDIGGMSILTNAHDVTIQDSIIGEGLYNSTHPESPHSHSLNITQLNNSGYPTRLTLYRNLITSSDTRNPQLIQPASVDFVNNVLYNWGKKSAYGNPKSLNLVNNYYVKGPQSQATTFWDLRVDKDYPTQNNSAVYESGNVSVGFTGTRGGPSGIYTSSPRFTSSISSPMTALNAYNYVVANVGANRPVRDVVDQRIINNLTNRTMVLPNGAANRFVNAADVVWPALASGTVPADSDNDGMPDSWEQQFFGTLSRGSASNSSSDFDGDGYTDLEEYLNGTNPADGTAPSSVQPTVQPTTQPTTQPITQPTTQPTAQPTAAPTQQPTAAPTSAPSGSAVKFAPSDDVAISKGDSASGQGTAGTLVVNDNPNTLSFLKFNVAGVSGRKVTKAVLRLYNTNGSDNGGRLRFIPSNDWNEQGLTWKTRPEPADGAVANLKSVSSGTWYELDVTSIVSGDGTYSFRLSTGSTDAAEYSSREGGNPPELVLTVSP